MKRYGRILIAALALSLAPLPALAQPVFFDDFDGDALLPHWNLPPVSDWEYNVSNGMLNVTNLLYPSNPKSPGNFAGMSAAFAPQNDFRIDVWMGWEAGQLPHRLELDIFAGPGGGPIIASFGYWNNSIFAGASNQAQFMAAPAPDIYHFTVSRTGTQVDFFFNGSPFASFSGTSGLPTAGLGFFFVGPYPGTFGAFHIDRVIVVPAPGVLLVFSATFAITFGRRRNP